jgi:hypothetical protein
VFEVPRLEPRLQRRYQHLVTEQMSIEDSVAAGLRALPGRGTAFASTQAAWRFYRNPAVTLPRLAEPLHQAARLAAETELGAYALVIHDWSELNFIGHTSKKDRIPIRHQKYLGYSLQTALLISDRDGTPIAPLGLSLWAQDGVHTTRSPDPLPDRAPLDEITDAIDAAAAVGLAKPMVHIVDRGGDSVGHYRRWQARDQFFVVRARAVPQVEYDGQVLRLGAVVERLSFRAGQAVEISSAVIGQQLVAETHVTITRPAFPHRQAKGVKEHRERDYGEPIRLRLIVSRILTPDDGVWAEWLLLTNMPEAVTAEQIAEWYVWRWRVESYFKLAKSAGHHVEQWQQESAEAIAKRLLVTAMACVVVWQLARTKSRQAEAARSLLVRLSGRQTSRQRPASEPAMLSGLWVLLSALDALDEYDVEDLREAAHLILPGFARYDTS